MINDIALELLFQSPQWGSNSKADFLKEYDRLSSFSPRNGEVILKYYIAPRLGQIMKFQSPQWGSNSKGELSSRMQL